MARRKIFAAGWALIALAAAIVVVIIVVGTLGTSSEAGFGHWGIWATIAVLPITLIGILLQLLDKISGSRDFPEQDMQKAEDDLASVVLDQASLARSRLIGTDEPGDRPADTPFAKSEGRFREAGGADGGDLSSVLEYYKTLSPGRLVVLGEPGAGKTVLLLELQVRLLESRRHDRSVPVPVLISAAAYDTRMNWEVWLTRHLTQRFAMQARQSARLVGARRVLPLVDGVDEMDPVGQPQRARLLIEALNAWMSGGDRADVVVTCRDNAYQALGRGVDRATVVRLTPLTGREAAAYLRGQFVDLDEQSRWEPVLATLDAERGMALAGRLATPWLLTLAVTAFRDGGDPSVLLSPDTPPAVACDSDPNPSRLADHLLLESYIPAVSRLHDQSGRYKSQDVQRWLSALADDLDWQARHGGSGTDIRLDQWWQPAGRWAVRFAHATLAALLGLPMVFFVAVVSGR